MFNNKTNLTLLRFLSAVVISQYHEGTTKIYKRDMPKPNILFLVKFYGFNSNQTQVRY